MILKSNMMPQIKEAFVGSQRKYKIYITISTQFCSDVSIMGTIFSSNWHLIFVLSFLNFRFVVCVLAAVIFVISSTWCFEDLFSCREWTQLFAQKCVPNYQTYFENQLNKFWIWNSSMLMKYHTSDSAECIRIIWAQFRGQLFGTPKLTALKHLRVVWPCIFIMKKKNEMPTWCNNVM